MQARDAQARDAQAYSLAINAQEIGYASHTRDAQVYRNYICISFINEYMDSFPFDCDY